MKQFLGLVTLLTLFLISACSDESAKSKKEVVVVPVQPVIVEKDPPKKATTVTLDNTGVKVETKKVDVSVKP